MGLGYWGTKIAREYLKVQRETGLVKLAAVFDKKHAAVSKFLDHYPLARSRAYFGLDEFLESQIQGVHICTPNDTHYQLAELALEFGKGVLVEKPLTTDYSQAEKLLRTGRNSNLPVLTGHIYRFNNGVRKAAGMISRGSLGKVSHLGIQWKALANFPERQRDILFDIGPHPFDIANILIKNWPNSVRSSLHAPRSKGINEVAYLQARYPKGRTAHIELNWVFPTKTRSVAVIGDKRSLLIDCLAQDLSLFTRNRVQRVEVDKNNAMQDELLYFARCCSSREDPKRLGEKGLQVVRILDRMIKKTGSRKKREK
jgi:predicted dehydrogenase